MGINTAVETGTGSSTSKLSLFAALRELATNVSPRRRRQFLPLLGLMLVGALAELLSLGAIFPFLAVVSQPETAVADERLQPLLSFVGIQTPTEIVVAAAALFAISAVIAAAVRMLLVWASQKFVFGIAQELSILVYSRTLHQPYSYHTEHNSAQTLAAINKTQILTTALLVPLMQATSASVISIFILLGLLFIDPFVALASGLGFSLIYLTVVRFTRARMRRNGGIIAATQKERVQAANEGLGGIRDVLLDRSQSIFIRRFASVESALRTAQATNNFISQCPRFIVEGLGLVLIALLAVALSLRDGGLAAALPVLGALALGAQRLMPLLQQLFTGWSAGMTNGQMLYDVLAVARLPEAAHYRRADTQSILRFEDAITLQKIGFSYPEANRPALENLNVLIPKGARVGFVGKTGSGKSTLMDLILGLLTPETGRILIDEQELNDANRSSWQARIAHVPQVIYLSDASIAENIAFGVPRDRIDMERVRQSAQQAELTDVIEKLPQGYESFVGERGVRLSGGQRQRIGIARALYKQADVLVFDEATSALDNETERTVMASIERLDRTLTILIIAHRLSTIEKCDFVVKLDSSSSSVN